MVEEHLPSAPPCKGGVSRRLTGGLIAIQLFYNKIIE